MWRGRGYHRQMRGGWEWGAGSAGVHREGSEHGAVTATDRRLRFKVTLTAVRGTGCTDEGVGARGPGGTRPADRGDGRRRADSGSSRSAGPRVRPRPARGTEPRGRGGCAQRPARASGPRRPGAWGLGPEVAWTAPPARGVPLASREAFSVLALSRRRQRKREKRWFSANVGD